MAKKSLIAQQNKLEKEFMDYKHWGKKPKSVTKYYNRCKLCWRVKSYMREFWVCICCFRKNVILWQIMLDMKASR